MPGIIKSYMILLVKQSAYNLAEYRVLQAQDHTAAPVRLFSAGGDGI
ncbi:MAG: hypothetical protein HFI57_14175 [Lachnospiraceae bacterium]|nr:hypothetical protein [Lachnospiraceae bacterium]